MAEQHSAQPGESWAYRARSIDDLVEVVVVRLGTQRPARVLVRFVDDRFEGRQEWVPPSRLKVRWQAVDDFRERESLWERLISIGVNEDGPLENAAWEVFEKLIEPEVAIMLFRRAGACSVNDSDRLSQLTGLSPEVWTSHPAAFQDGDQLVAPWPVTEQIAAATACTHAAQVLDEVGNEEREARHDAIYGRVYRGRNGAVDFVVEPERCAQGDNEYGKPKRDILRSWCGADAVERYDELTELRKEIRRVGELADAAIRALHTAGNTREAAELSRQLGTRVDMLGESAR
ncbi:hypothetical protein [Mycobacterium malmoense]|uniref:hypothetical protein n=1 Tax=Mycobacterium malmoense TaxID=1780 RepID=UPI001131D68C|nr:hypothetical protein [Mycobacterium malmoense]